MKHDLIKVATEMALVSAICDYAKMHNIDIEKARHILCSTKYIDLLFDYANGFWKEGPDAYIRLIK